LVVVFLQHIFGRRFTKKHIFDAKKMKNDFFYVTKIKTSQTNIVFHSKMQTCAQYGVVRTNYVVVVAITSSFGLKAIELRTR
jgi:hypothetical protein